MHPIDQAGPALAALMAFVAVVAICWALTRAVADHLRDRRFARRPSAARLEALGRIVKAGDRRG